VVMIILSAVIGVVLAAIFGVSGLIGLF
jgi:hypothetical protein